MDIGIGEWWLFRLAECVGLQGMEGAAGELAEFGDLRGMFSDPARFGDTEAVGGAEKKGGLLLPCWQQRVQGGGGSVAFVGAQVEACFVGGDLGGREAQGDEGGHGLSVACGADARVVLGERGVRSECGTQRPGVPEDGGRRAAIASSTNPAGPPGIRNDVGEGSKTATDTGSSRAACRQFGPVSGRPSLQRR